MNEAEIKAVAYAEKIGWDAAKLTEWIDCVLPYSDYKQLPGEYSANKARNIIRNYGPGSADNPF